MYKNNPSFGPLVKSQYFEGNQQQKERDGNGGKAAEVNSVAIVHHNILSTITIYVNNTSQHPYLNT